MQHQQWIGGSSSRGLAVDDGCRNKRNVTQPWPLVIGCLSEVDSASNCRPSPAGRNNKLIVEQSWSLAGVFLNHGASGVLATLWVVDDYTARVFLLQFMDRWEAGSNAGEAYDLTLRDLWAQLTQAAGLIIGLSWPLSSTRSGLSMAYLGSVHRPSVVLQWTVLDLNQ